MNYIILDLEWNTPVSKNRIVRNPIQLNGEIIQIGAVKLNEDLEEIDFFDEKICPKYYKKINHEVHAITDFTYEQLKGERPFKEVVNEFRQWCDEDSVIFTWGPCDTQCMKENLEINGMDGQWIPETFDAQLMFDDLEMGEMRQFSLDYAVYHYGIKGNKAHDALNDARDTAEVIRNLDIAEWMEEERQWREQTVELEAAE